MIHRILHATVVMAGCGLAMFWWLLKSGWPVEEARNLLLLLFVIFENIQTFNSRSERQSALTMNISSNPALILGVVGAQLLHALAMHVPWLSETLALQPVTVQEWAATALVASSILLVMEFDKWRDRQM